MPSGSERGCGAWRGPKVLWITGVSLPAFLAYTTGTSFADNQRKVRLTALTAVV